MGDLEIEIMRKVDNKMDLMERRTWKEKLGSFPCVVRFYHVFVCGTK